MKVTPEEKQIAIRTGDSDYGRGYREALADHGISPEVADTVRRMGYRAFLEQALSAPAPDGCVKATEELGWVIERYVNSELRYWDGRGVGDECFVTDNLEAVRFAREMDAAAILSYLFRGIGRVAEHMWTDPGARE